MTIKYHSLFLKHYKKRIASNPSLKKRFTERIKLFSKDKNNLILHNHPLSGDMKGYFSFSITGDIRVVYKEEPNKTILFYDIGTHNQVYK